MPVGFNTTGGSSRADKGGAPKAGRKGKKSGNIGKDVGKGPPLGSAGSGAKAKQVTGSTY